MNKRERANPTVTTSTTSADGAGNSSTSTTTKQGDVDPNESAIDFAQSKPLRKEYHQYQGANYLGVLEQLLGG